MLPDTTGYCISAKCYDVSKYDLHSSGSISGIQARLKKVAEEDPGDLSRIEILHGFKYEPEGLLQDPWLDIDFMQVFAWDFMHCYLVGGGYEREVGFFCEALSPHDLGLAKLDQYVKRWVWPQGYAHAKDCFSTKKFTGTASEQISLSQVISKYARDVVIAKGVCVEMAHSMIAVCDVVGLLSIANSGLVSSKDLGVAIIHHLSLREAAYGDVWKPKDHWVTHLPRQLLVQKALFSTFLMERKHRVLKRAAQSRHNTQGFDCGVMEETTVQHLHDLKLHAVTDVDLLGPKPASRKLQQAIVEALPVPPTAQIIASRSVHVNCRAVYVGDVVALSIAGSVQFGKVWFHAKIDGVLVSGISLWEIVSFDLTLARCLVHDRPEIVPTAAIVEPCVFFKAPPGSISQVLFPPKLKLRAAQLA